MALAMAINDLPKECPGASDTPLNAQQPATATPMPTAGPTDAEIEAAAGVAAPPSPHAADHGAVPIPFLTGGADLHPKSMPIYTFGCLHACACGRLKTGYFADRIFLPRRCGLLSHPDARVISRGHVLGEIRRRRRGISHVVVLSSICPHCGHEGHDGDARRVRRARQFPDREDATRPTSKRGPSSAEQSEA